MGEHMLRKRAKQHKQQRSAAVEEAMQGDLLSLIAPEERRAAMALVSGSLEKGGVVICPVVPSSGPIQLGGNDGASAQIPPQIADSVRKSLVSGRPLIGQLVTSPDSNGVATLELT